MRVTFRDGREFVRSIPGYVKLWLSPGFAPGYAGDAQQGKRDHSVSVLCWSLTQPAQSPLRSAGTVRRQEHQSDH